MGRSRSSSSLAALALTFLLTAFLPATAAGDDDKSDPGKSSLSFATTFGIAGLRNLVDARIPEQLSLRTVLRYELLLNSTASDTAVDSTYSNAVTLTIGGSVFGRLDAGVHWPFYLEKTVTNETFGQGSQIKTYEWIPSIDFGGKGGGALDWIDEALRWLSVSPYALVHLSWGEEVMRLDGYQAFEVGLAGTVALLENRLSLHLNLGFSDTNAGSIGFRYRVGILGVPVGFSEFLVRLGFYVEGLEGPSGGNLRVAFGVQTLIHGMFAFDVSGDYRVYAGMLANGLSDNGTGGLSVGIGFRPTF